MTGYWQEYHYPSKLHYATQVKCLKNSHYVPDFTSTFDRFLIHTGGKAVIEGIQAGLNLDVKHCQASIDTLKRFGNTSAASTW